MRGADHYGMIVSHFSFEVFACRFLYRSQLDGAGFRQKETQQMCSVSDCAGCAECTHTLDGFAGICRFGGIAEPAECVHGLELEPATFANL